MKGKGHKVTASNLASDTEMHIGRPLTTDPWDNAVLVGKTEAVFENKRLCRIAGKAVRMCLDAGFYLLDGLNMIVVTDGISFTQITRTNLDNNHFLLEIHEEDSPSQHDR